MKTKTYFSGAVLAAVFMTASGSELLAQQVKYRYDKAGRLTSVTYDDAATIGYTYDMAGNLTEVTTIPTATGLEDERAGVPRVFTLHDNYPNPFNPSTSIQYDVPKQAVVLLEIFDVQGRKVTTLLDEVRSPGYHRIEWDTGSQTTGGVSSGLYLLRMKSGTFVATQRMVLMK